MIDNKDFSERISQKIKEIYDKVITGELSLLASIKS